ncbi:MAG: hypothetical protein K2F57_03175 [Candidatus Gastranaerophilales bacterium]|nr:hypothetical protein [Candidatus Gastranaerophilales bacterium]
MDGTKQPWENDNGWGLNIITFTIAKDAWFDMDGHSENRCNSMFGIDTKTECLVIYFDVNGAAKPNILGKDIYAVVQTEKGLVPAGADRTKAQVNQNCNNGDWHWCLQKVVNDSFTISERVLKR